MGISMDTFFIRALGLLYLFVTSWTDFLEPPLPCRTVYADSIYFWALIVNFFILTAFVVCSGALHLIQRDTALRLHASTQFNQAEAAQPSLNERLEYIQMYRLTRNPLIK